MKGILGSALGDQIMTGQRTRIMTEDVNLDSSSRVEIQIDTLSDCQVNDIESCRSFQSGFEKAQETSFAAACK